MKTMFKRMLAVILCLSIPCAALAESAAPAGDAVHAEFSLGFGLHADAFPPSDLHCKDWETYLDKITIAGSLDGMNMLRPDCRTYTDAALYLNGTETIPFLADCYGPELYLISPMMRDDPLLFYMHSYFEFMLKFYYYLGLPANYIALVTYPSAWRYIADSYYMPVSDEIMEARAAALSRFGDEPPQKLTYLITYDRMLRLCDTLNAVATDDTVKRVRWFLGALLAELYLSDVVLDAVSHLDVAYRALDPGKDGLLFTETADSMVCTVGGQEIFKKSVSGNVTEIVFTLPMPDTYMVSFTYRGETVDQATAFSADFSVAEGEDVLFWASLEGGGLPAEGSLGGEGQLAIAVGGSTVGETPAPQTVRFSWSRTAGELPYDLDLTLDWLHPETGLPAISAALQASVSASDESVFVEESYPTDHFFGINPVQLEDYKSRWLHSIIAYLLPVVLEMPIGVIDDTVAFLLDNDILLSITE